MNEITQKILVKALVHTSAIWSEETFLKIFYRIKVGKRLDLDNPQTYNEKLQWL